MAIRNIVTMNVNKDFYDRVFQRERKKYASQIGMPLNKFTNTKFTAFLAKKQVVFKLSPFKSLPLINKKNKSLWCI